MMNERRATTSGRAGLVGQARHPELEPDTSGHTLLACEFGTPVELERRRQAEQAARDLGRLAERRRRALLGRIHRRQGASSEARR
jgi:hypothetical protein